MLAVKQHYQIQEELDLQIDTTVFWTDSTMKLEGLTRSSRIELLLFAIVLVCRSGDTLTHRLIRSIRFLEVSVDQTQLKSSCGSTVQHSSVTMEQHGQSVLKV